MKKNKIVSLFLIGVLLLTAGCAKTPKLENGKEVFASIDGYKITADDLYASLKEKGGLSVMLEMIDNHIIDKEIKDKSGAESYADGQISMYKEYYGDEFESTLKNYGYSSIENFREIILNDYLKQKVALNYLKKKVTDDEVKAYYDENIFGDLTVRYILIKPAELDADASDEDKLKAENEALNEAKEIIKKINNGEKFEDLAKEYSKDSSASDGGNLGYFNRGDMVSEFEDAVVALEVGKYTKEPVKTQYGYHIILKTDQKEKPKLEEIKDKIKDTLAKDLVANTENISAFALDWLREKNNLKIYDAELKIKYDHYMNQQKSAKSTTNQQ